VALSDSGRGLRGEIWTVSELSSYIRELFEIDYRLRDIEVSGEISNFSRARSGHLYFTLKDENSQIRCVMWRQAAERLPFGPEDGDAVIVTGRVSVYEAGGNYQLYAERIEQAGRGDLAIAFERLKNQLADEGLFDGARKKPIARFPRKIGIVTSADAAALRDILNVMGRRFPLVHILIAPTLVQGSGAPAQIARAIQWLDGRTDIDTIIVARGGGSIEDLWAFNDEAVARAIFGAQHPIITGIGHETDFTIADFVADVRAPTPSAAAEMAVPDAEEISALISQWQGALLGKMTSIVEQKRWQLSSLARALRHLSPRANVDADRQRVDQLNGRLEQAIALKLGQLSNRHSIAQARLWAVSPLGTLRRGYAIVRDEEGAVVRSVQNVAKGDELKIQVSDGEITATSSEVTGNAA
jgi:exodeoxyribonuclease VII large subunit